MYGWSVYELTQKYPEGKVHSVSLRFRLGLSLSLNGWMAIQWQNSHQIIIHQIWKSQSNGQMIMRQLFCLQNGIQPFDWLYPNLMNGNSVTALSQKYHLAIQTQTQT